MAMADRTLRAADPAVVAVFEAYPARVRGPLLDLRQLILATAEATPCVGTLIETLKWGQPSYLPATPRTGTTVRIDRIKTAEDAYGLYFHCQTTLVDDFRAMFSGQFLFEGNRAIHLSADKRPDALALGRCVALALTYHLRNRQR